MKRLSDDKVMRLKFQTCSVHVKGQIYFRSVVWLVAKDVLLLEHRAASSDGKRADSYLLQVGNTLNRHKYLIQPYIKETELSL